MSEENLSREQIAVRVAQALVQALGVSPGDITPETSLVADLEAESIDFLDVVFRLEKEFGFEIARGELFPQELLRDPALVAGGRLTPEGAAALRERFAFTDLSSLKAGASVDDLMNDLLTVRLIIDFVDSKLHRSVERT